MRMIRRLHYQVVTGGVIAGVIAMLAGVIPAVALVLMSDAASMDLTDYLQTLFVVALFSGGFRAGRQAPRSGGLHGAWAGMGLGCLPLLFWGLFSSSLPDLLLTLGALIRSGLVGAAGGAVGFNLTQVARKRLAGQRARS